MVRVKMPLKLIESERHRNHIFMKRRVVVKKKAMELGKLCDVVTLLVCFGPRGQLETWPEDLQEVRSIIDNCWRPNPDAAKCVKHRYDVASFFERHLKKLQGELARVRDSWLDGPLTTAEGLEDLARSLDAKLDAIDGRIAQSLVEAESWERDIELWLQSQESPPQQMPEEEMPPLPRSLPLDAVSDAQPFRSIEGLDYFSMVKLEQFSGGGHAAKAADAVSAWGDPHNHLWRSEMASNLPHATPNPYTLPSITDNGFGMDHTISIDDFINSNAFLPMDFATYPYATGTSGFSVVGVPTPTTTVPSPPSLCHDGLVGCSCGINPNLDAPPFDRAVDARYGFFLHHHLPPGNPAATMSNQMHPLSGQLFYGAGVFQGMHNTGPSPGDIWSDSIFHGLPPPACTSSNTVQALPTGGDGASFEFVPTSTGNPYAYKTTPEILY